MLYVVIGALGFPVFHLVDVAAIKRVAWAKPLAWIAGCSMIVFSAWRICTTGGKYVFPAWAEIAGWIFLIASVAQLVYSLFINLPFMKTYFQAGVGDELITGGLYGVVRHPGVYGLGITLFSLVIVSGARNMLTAASVWMAVDILVVIIQDRYFFDRMFLGYEEYRRRTPMLIPTVHSLATVMNGLTKKEIEPGRNKQMSNVAKLFAEGKYDEVWRCCCGFLDLSVDDFMRIQKRLLVEQIGLLEKCELGKHIFKGNIPQNIEEFREIVPLTTYADYAPYLLKRRMDVLPKKPLLWQYTSGKTGEYDHRWAPITAKAFDEIEPLIFAMMILAAATKRGEVNLHKNDKVLYSMAPPPYATGTIVRAFPHELFRMLPPVEEAEKMPFEERVKKGFDMALSEGMDMTICMSSVAVAIGQRFSRHAQGKRGGNNWLRQSPGALARLAQGMVKSKINRRQLLPRDLWKMKGLVTFGIDGEVFREKIKEMWGCYPLDFYGCTEAPVIAMQAWDHAGMTFVPHLNFFEFIPEADSLRSQEDPAFKPRTLLTNELEPGNYELVITSLHGGPFVRYRLGHMVKIISLRNDILDIDIPQMSFVSRVDDQIDIAGFTRLGEKVIWKALERSGVKYVDWVARKEVHGKPVLHLYVEMDYDERPLSAEKIADVIHGELKILDEPYAELETFTGLRPLMITLLPQGAFKTFELRQKAAGADLANVKAARINPDDETIKFLTGTTAAVRARGNTAEAKV